MRRHRTPASRRAPVGTRLCDDRGGRRGRGVRLRRLRADRAEPRRARRGARRGGAGQAHRRLQRRLLCGDRRAGPTPTRPSARASTGARAPCSSAISASSSRSRTSAARSRSTASSRRRRARCSRSRARPAASSRRSPTASRTWQDADSTPPARGAESSAYAPLGIKPRNAGFHTLGELRELRGMTDAILRPHRAGDDGVFGESGWLQRSDVADPGARGAGRGGAELARPSSSASIRSRATCRSRSR